jgi:F-type H+-transporting ATPase subunit c
VLALYGLALAVGLCMGLAVLGGALGQAHLANGAMNGMARQPELQGRIQMSMIIALAFVESLILFTLLVAFMLLGKLPPAKDVLETEKQVAYTQPMVAQADLPTFTIE